MDNFMNAVGKVLHSVWQSVQPWADRNVTFGLVLAIVTEVWVMKQRLSAASERVETEDGEQAAFASYRYIDVKVIR